MERPPIPGSVGRRRVVSPSEMRTVSMLRSAKTLDKQTRVVGSSRRPVGDAWGLGRCRYIDRHAGTASQDEAVEALRGCPRRDVGRAAEEFGESNFGLEARERRSETEMDTGAEAEVVLGIASDEELLGVGILTLVAIGRTEEHHHFRTRGELHAGELDCLAGLSEQRLDRRVVSKCLLDGAANETRSVA